MAEVRKVLGQVAPGATTLVDLYAVPAATQVVGSSLVICNQGGATTFRISVAVANAADNAKQYLFYDTPIGANAMVSAVLGMTLGPLDKVRVYAGAATLSFNLFGVEIT